MNIIWNTISFISFCFLSASSQTLSFREEVSSFGPNGTHWPSRIPTPFMYDENVVHQIEVDADWDAIEAAVLSVTDQMAGEGVLIKVRPGELIGDGIGSNSDVMLDNLGSLTWSKRITICPRDGYGTVAMNSTRLRNLKNICVAGFYAGAGMRYTGCQQSALAWMSFDSGWIGTYGAEGVLSSDIEFVEVVVRNHRGSNADTTQITNSGGEIRDWTWEGCYIAPVYIPLPKQGEPHSDTLQFFGTVGSYGDATFKDCAVFASDNTAIQTGGIDGLFLDHTLLVSGQMVYEYYPVPIDGENDATKSLNGSGKNFRAKDSIIIGGMAMSTSSASGRLFTSVENTQATYQPGGVLIPEEGAWTVSTGLTSSNISGYPAFPTDAFLAGIWSKDRVIFSEPDDEVPSVPEGLAGTVLSSTSVELTWMASTDNQAVVGYFVTNGGQNVQSVSGTSFIVEGLAPLTSYDFSVYSFDGSGNQSALSPPVPLTTLEPEPRPDPNDFLDYHWSFDDGSTVDTVSGVIGTPAGTPTLIDNEALFCSAGDRIDVPALNILGDQITLACWVELDSFENANEARFISKATSINGDDHYWMLGNFGDGSAVRFRLRLGQTTYTLVSSEGILALDTRYHIAATYDGDAMRIFVDGSLVAEQASTSNNDIATSDTSMVGLGNQPTGAGDRGLIGTLDDVRIYSYAVPVEDLSIIMEELNTGYDDWLAENGLSDLADEDTDQDGFPLLLEYAFGTDPNEYSTSPISLTETESTMSVTFPRLRDDIDYLIETSEDLNDWGSDHVDQVTGEIDNSMDALFLRIRITRD